MLETELMRWRYPLLSGVVGCGGDTTAGAVTMVAMGVITRGAGSMPGVGAGAAGAGAADVCTRKGGKLAKTEAGVASVGAGAGAGEAAAP
jgi:hypothetical protein